MSERKPELLAPAGDGEKLRYAIAYGADAVYVGGESFSLREKSGNFTLAELKAATAYCHQRGKKIYVAVNIFAHEDDIAALPPYLQALNDIGPDALLIADPGVFSLAREHAPAIPIHISTQANNVNGGTVAFWRDLGATRVVLGRELSGEEIAAIRRQTDTELEVFVHGAMCMAYSGRCLLSNFLAGRDANAGACTHPCRWQYALVEAERPGEYLPIDEDGRGSYIMNSKDLCLLPHLPRLMDMGIDALKIEGRVKSVYYVAVVTAVYRAAIDAYATDPTAFTRRLPDFLTELRSVSHRRYCDGFFSGRPDAEGHRYDTSAYERRYDFVAVVRSFDAATSTLILEERNRFAVGDTLEFFTPDGETATLTVTAMADEAGQPLAVANRAQMAVRLPSPRPFPALTVVRRKRIDP